MASGAGAVMSDYFSPFLIDEPPLTISPSLAKKVGVNHAIFLQQMHYWLRKSKHTHDGHKWVYNSYAEWQKQMPWLTVRGVRKVIGDLEKGGYIVSGNFNRMAFDKTKWYRIDYKPLCGIEHSMCQEVSDDAPEMADDVSQSDASDVAQSDTPIPETTQETTNNQSVNRPRAKKRRQNRFDYTEEFESFWQAYPKVRRLAKGEAFSEWSAIDPDPALIEKIMAAIQTQVAHRKDWKKENGKYIPHPSRWLKNGRWDDEVETNSTNDSDDEWLVL